MSPSDTRGERINLPGGWYFESIPWPDGDARDPEDQTFVLLAPDDQIMGEEWFLNDARDFAAAIAPPPAGGDVAGYAKRLVDDLCLEVREVEALLHSGRRLEMDDLEGPLGKRAAARGALLAAFASRDTEIAALKRETERLRAEKAEWQDAATAPTDGSTFIGYSKHGVSEWICDDGDFMPVVSLMHLKLNGASSHWPLEGWRPLPEPPRHPAASTDSAETGEAERG